MSKISKNLLKTAKNNFGEEKEIYKTITTIIDGEKIIDYVFKVRNEEYNFFSDNFMEMLSNKITNDEMAIKMSKYFVKNLTTLDIEDYSIEELVDLPYNEHVSKILESVQELMEFTIKTINESFKKINKDLEKLPPEEIKSLLSNYQNRKEDVNNFMELENKRRELIEIAEKLKEKQDSIVGKSKEDE